MTFVIQTPVSHPLKTGSIIQTFTSDITCHQLHSFIYYMYICQRKKDIHYEQNHLHPFNFHVLPQRLQGKGRTI